MVEHRRAIALAPTVAVWRNNLAWSLVRAGRPSEAVAVLKEALRCDPSSVRAKNNLAFAMALAGQVDEAVRQFTRAGTEAAATNNLGLVLEVRGDRGLACERYREAAALDPQLAVATRNVARACSAVNRGGAGKRLASGTEER